VCFKNSAISVILYLSVRSLKNTGFRIPLWPWICLFYTPEERETVIREAYKGLYQLANTALFEKYTEFIDIYAEIREDERESLCNELIEHKETAMLAQYIKDKGVQQGEMGLLCKQFSRKFQISSEILAARLKHLNPDAITELGERIFEWESFEQIKEWIKNRKIS